MPGRQVTSLAELIAKCEITRDYVGFQKVNSLSLLCFMKNTLIALSAIGVASAATVNVDDFVSFFDGAGGLNPTGSFVVTANGTDILTDTTISYTITGGLFDNVGPGAVGAGASQAGGLADAIQNGEVVTIAFAITSAGLPGGTQTLDILSYNKERGGTISVSADDFTTADTAGTGSRDITGIQQAATFTGVAGNSSVRSFVLDVTSVPEPTSAALLGLGGLALVTRRKR